MVFNQVKFKIIYFSWKKHFANMEIVLLSTLMANIKKKSWIIKLIIKKESMYWLGVYFDFCLLFSDHAAKMTSKSQKTMASLAILVKTTRGVEVVIMRKTVHTCIPPILTPEMPAW